MKSTLLLILITCVYLLTGCSGAKFKYLNKVTADFKPTKDLFKTKIQSSTIYHSELTCNSEFVKNPTDNVHFYIPTSIKQTQQKFIRSSVSENTKPTTIFSDTSTKKPLIQSYSEPKPQNKKNIAATFTLISFLLGLLAVISGSALYVGVFFSICIIFGIIAFVKYYNNDQWLMLIIPIVFITYSILGLLLFFSI